MEGFLKCGAHKRVSRSRELQYLKVYPEKREIHDSGENNESDSAGNEVFPELFL
jgi:hypothetical protein